MKKDFKRCGSVPTTVTVILSAVFGNKVFNFGHSFWKLHKQPYPYEVRVQFWALNGALSVCTCFAQRTELSLPSHLILIGTYAHETCTYTNQQLLLTAAKSSFETIRFC